MGTPSSPVVIRLPLSGEWLPLVSSGLGSAIRSKANSQPDRPPMKTSHDRTAQLPARGMASDALAAGPPTGELVVLPHGFPHTSACWTLRLETLAAAGYRAVAPDQRGYSPTARPTTVSAHRLPELVAGTQGLWSAYLPVFRLPRLPELPLGAPAGGCAGCWPGTGWGSSGSTPTLVPWPGRGHCRRRRPGTGRPRRSVCGPVGWGCRRCMSGGRVIPPSDRGRPSRPGDGSPAPTVRGASWCRPLAARAPRRGAVACHWSTCDGGSPGQQRRESGPADIECDRLGGGSVEPGRRLAGPRPANHLTGRMLSSRDQAMVPSSS